MNPLLTADGTLDLAAVRRHLLGELGLVLGRHDKITAHLQNEDRDLTADWSEMAQLIENDEVLEALEESGRERIEALRAALQRLDEGRYGECVACGGEISAGRLAALPTSQRCIDCA